MMGEFSVKSKKYLRKHNAFVHKIAASVLSAAIVGTSFAGIGSAFALQTNAATERTNYGLASTSQKGVILHCWNWSYNNIKKYMKDIAAAGYTSVQTSPVQQPKDYYWEGVAYGNVGIPDGIGGYDGNWWKFYQPVTFSVCDNGHTWLGTKAEFKAMCDEAEKYGVKVIVDIVANHMGNIQGYKIGDVETVMGDISKQVGEFWESDMLIDPTYWHISTSWTHSSDGRFDVTQGNMGMPDLNTGDKRVQNMVLGLLNECIDCGADGFRFDAAKHIETPADDPKFASDFWDVVLDGARAHYKEVNGYDGVYFYGEVLNRLDDSKAEAYYRSKMSITDNSTSDNLRNSVINGQVSALSTSGYCGYIAGQGDKCVLWAESHDTYMGGGSSYDACDADIKKTWAIIASRKDSTGLFFARPYYSKDILAGDVSKARQSTSVILENIGEQTQLGDVGSLTWADPEVVAVNRFRNFFVGSSEKLGSSGNTAYNMRSNTGIVIVRGEGPGPVSLNVGMANGTYTDQITGEKFTVSGGTIKGEIKNANGIAVIYNPTVDYGTVNPVQPSVLRISASTADGKSTFNTNTVDVTMSVQGAKTASYTTSEGASGTFTTEKTIKIGALTATDGSVTLTVNAKADDGTSKSKSYTFTKKGKRVGYPTLNSGGVVFDNSEYKWSKVYCYVYDSAKKNNAGWPGIEMTEENGDYWSYEIPSTLSGTVYVIFNNGSGVQYPSGEGLKMDASEKKLFVSNALTDLPKSTESLSISFTATPSTVSLGNSVTLKAVPSNNKGTVKYSFIASDGTVISSSSTSNTCQWTPKKTGIYIVAVNAVDSESDITATKIIKVVQSSDVDLTNSTSISSKNITLGDSVTFKVTASGGTSPYTYSLYYKKTSDTIWTTAKAYGTSSTMTLKPTQAGTYDVCTKVKDSKGTVAKIYDVITVTSTKALTNSTSISSKNITLGNSITFKVTASGGTSPYSYGLYYKKTSDTSWTTAKSYGTASTMTFKPTQTGTYDVCTKVKDSKGTVAKIYDVITVTSTKALTNSTSISSKNITLGNSITFKVTASGGTSPYSYGLYYKKTSDTSWTTAKSYGTASTMTFKPTQTGTYDVCTKVKDSKGTVAKIYDVITVTSTKALTNSTSISSKNITLGNSITFKVTASGGTSPYSYGLYYKKTSDTSWTTAKSYGTASTMTFKPTQTGTYDVCTKVKDSKGTVAKIYDVITVTSTKALTNSTSISSKNITLGNSITFKVTASGGTSPYSYGLYYKKTSDTSWTTAKSYGTASTMTLKPTQTGTYDVCAKVKDSKGTIAKQYFTVTVSK